MPNMNGIKISLTFDGVGINDASNPYRPRLATFDRRLTPFLVERLGRLLCSAPDLLDALQEAVDTICYLKPERFDDPEHEKNFNELLDRIYAVIEEATGEE